MGDAGGGKKVHLFLCGAHEEEAGGVKELAEKSAADQRHVVTGEEVLAGLLTNGVMYWKLLVSPTSASDTVFLS